MRSMKEINHVMASNTLAGRPQHEGLSDAEIEEARLDLVVHHLVLDEERAAAAATEGKGEGGGEEETRGQGAESPPPHYVSFESGPGDTLRLSRMIRCF